MQYKTSEKGKYYASSKAWRNKVRLKALNALGGAKCSNCGCKDIEILEINHIKGGGRTERRTKYKNFYSFYLEVAQGERSADDLNVLCIICNALHRIEMGYGKKISSKFKIIYKNNARDIEKIKEMPFS